MHRPSIRTALPTGVALTFFTQPANAHTKWVVTPADAASQGHAPLDGFFFDALAHYPWVPALALIGFLLVFWLDRRLQRAAANVPDSWYAMERVIPAIFSVSLGLLLLRSGIYNHLFFPNLVLDSLPIRILTGILGGMLLCGFLPRLAAVGVAGAYSLGGLVFGKDILDYPILLGMAFYVMVRQHPWWAAAAWGRQEWDLFQPLSRWSGLAMPVLRVLAGLSLIIPGIDKFTDPNLNMAVITKYGIRLPGISDTLFLFGAGWVETGLGLLVLLGLAPRLVAGILLVVFIPATLAGSFAFDMAGEIFDHLPFIAFGLAYLLEGNQAGLREIVARIPASNRENEATTVQR